MLVEAKYPFRLERELYDHYLEMGFFRSSSMFYKTQMLCIGTQLSSVINIRVNLRKHSFSKSQRKILRKVKQNFTIKASKYFPTEAMESLYQQHKGRFKGFLYPNLDSFLTMGSTQAYEYFDTYKVEVFDQDRLIAFSLFDQGKKSMASLLGVFDEDYAQYSLGIFTMLQEVELAKGNNISHYYPGYILHNNHEFDYKLRLGEIEVLDWGKGWLKGVENKPTQYLSDLIEDKTTTANKQFVNHQIQTKVVYYPNFSLGYLMPMPAVLKSPLFIEIENTKLPGRIMLEFDHKLDKYRLGKIKIVKSIPEEEKLEISTDYLHAQNIELNLCEYEKVMWSGNNLHEVIPYLKSQSNK